MKGRAGDARGTDATTMRALVEGDNDAVQRVVDQLAPLVRGVGRRIVGDAGADDVVQETFERLWRHAHRFDPARGTLEAWTLRIARNTALGHLRRTRPHERLSAAEPADPSPSPAEQAERAVLCAAVRDAVGRLPTQRRRSVEQVLAGSTLVEAAQRLGVPEGTLKSRVRAAHADLRIDLADLADLAAAV
ncbi:MAG: RNA polymerase sigma factor [Acidimicrobiia bacterium]|nr:RNA polymerase sigma factor [Acidimicrobiia bacterium]